MGTTQHERDQSPRSTGVKKTVWPYMFVNYLFREKKKKDRNSMHLS